MKKIIFLTMATLMVACVNPKTEVEVVAEKCDTIKACVDTCKVETCTVTPTVAPTTTVK